MDVANFSWVDYIIISNPQGAMKVLDNFGYTGYLAPQDHDEMEEAILDLVHRHGDEAVVALLKSHPLYDVIKDIEYQNDNYRFATDNGNDNGNDNVTIFDQLSKINIKSFAENALAIIGFVYLVNMIINLLKK